MWSWILSAYAADIPVARVTFTYLEEPETCELRTHRQDLCAAPMLSTDGRWIQLRVGKQRFWVDPQPGQEVTWGPVPCSDLSMSAVGAGVRSLSVAVELDGDSPAYLVSSMGTKDALQTGRNEPVDIWLSALCTSPITLAVVDSEAEAWSPGAGRCSVTLLPVGGGPPLYSDAEQTAP